MSGYRRAGYPPPPPHPSSPPHTILLLAVVAIFLVVPQFVAEQTSFEALSEANPLMVMVAPLFLVLVIRWLSSMGKRGGGGVVPVGGAPYSVSRSSGGSPLGVAIVLLIVLLMVWYQSSSEEDEESE